MSTNEPYHSKTRSNICLEDDISTPVKKNSASLCHSFLQNFKNFFFSQVESNVFEFAGCPKNKNLGYFYVENLVLKTVMNLFCVV